MYRFGFFLFLFSAILTAHAAENIRLDASASFHVNSSNDYLLGRSLSHPGYRFGFNHSFYDQEGSSGFFGGRYRLMSSFSLGALDLSLDTHLLDDDSGYGTRVFSPQLTYFSGDRKLYVDLGYAYSRYDENNVKVHQLTPTLGFTWNHRDWFQFRGFFINPSEAGAEQLYTAAEGSWTRRLNGFLGLSRFKASALLGRRVFFVDQELKTIHGYGGEQGGSLSFSLQWRLPYNWDLMFQNSIEEVYDRGGADPYRLNYGFFGIERRW